eukprot:CAMPEP_0172542716 /NCGR_PEP_ID=MMETSP1067-20121228/13279_1 /TAXON_ID=265564 ORGANISM="Thalassiosira punctigera, Strain Tpunct2005C2" /NCGR_SAMPLE_ID=MMETSP1067 /ASSEMBLY_ACC=CAM_ASM_000444 /LENGTH=93 /DNA_ID=CAMNT_0013329007 /DNA_START=13 /DNA_END=290 /DNA_ORIENTATION=+
MTLYESCAASHGSDDAAVLQCIASSLEYSISGTTKAVDTVATEIATVVYDLDSLKDGLDIFFLIFAATVMFFMQAGFAMICAGSVQSKNLQNT